ncbi:hypothetical protein P170DRAFT_440209 [Aspergillus steynii IBT 23096]|uniref:Uncharacterized protein n=1 Tax=Aspergillus steynii IBT 23096 TaxID=1392250 RepID=A0A2I2FWQ9_9EURO|nr:uncharacterized protein P170DRAFT_440209 [Aspergillus steynii IBT 23096]PLB45073.1 hypothetical protein P170DRAFT_440209 [Aspergillus steynii IBT 23096]
MAPTKQELSLLINPLVPESVQHNNRVRASTSCAPVQCSPSALPSFLSPESD